MVQSNISNRYEQILSNLSDRSGALSVPEIPGTPGTHPVVMDDHFSIEKKKANW